MFSHGYVIKKKGPLEVPLKYPIGGIRGSEKSVLMHYRCADRKSCVAMATSNTHEKIIAPYTISILPKAPLVQCLDYYECIIGPTQILRKCIVIIVSITNMHFIFR